MTFKQAACLNGDGAMHFLLSTVVKHVLKFKYGWCNMSYKCLAINCIQGSDIKELSDLLGEKPN